MAEPVKTIMALVDPVGIKAGMDCYDTALGRCVANAGYKVFVYSNFRSTGDIVSYVPIFGNAGKTGAASFPAVVRGLFMSMRACRRLPAAYVVLHFFDGGPADLCACLMASLFHQRIVLIVHEVTPVEKKGFALFRTLLLRRFGKRMIVHNGQARAELEALRGNRPGRVTVIPHPHFPDLAGKALAGPVEGLAQQPEIRYLLFFGQLKKSKGLDVLLQALAGLEDHVHLVAAGRCRDVTYIPYLDLAGRLGLRHRFHVLNRFISPDERNRLLGLADAVVLPYRRGYQSGVMITAMSAGRTVVASDMASHREIIRHGENGLLFKTGDPASLAAVLKEFYAGRPDRATLEKNALLTMREAHGCDVLIRLYDSLFAP